MNNNKERDLKPSHRSKIEVLSCILKHSNPSSSMTAYKCEISSSQFDLFKDCLVDAGFLKVIKTQEEELFETTMKGKKFLNDYLRVKNLSVDL